MMGPHTYAPVVPVLQKMALERKIRQDCLERASRLPSRFNRVASNVANIRHQFHQMPVVFVDPFKETEDADVEAASSS
jgi:hypothetical protein